MSCYEHFINSLFSDYELIREYENDMTFEVDLNAKTFVQQQFEVVNAYLSFLQINDSLVCTVNFGDSDPISYYSNKSNAEVFIQDLLKENDYHDEEVISIKIIISKNIVDQKCNIYSLEAFVKTINSLTISQFLNVFTRIFSDKEYIIFKVYGLEKPFNTKNIYFSGFDKEVIPVIYENRITFIENFNSVCHYSNSEILRLTPIDFKFINTKEVKKELFELFEFYSIVISIIYLFDITTLLDNQIEFKVNGYKSIKGSIDLKSFKTNHSKEYFDIFKWVYTGGNLNDKIGLARNIISLHFIKKGEVDLQENTYESIQSSYKVYEKQNIKQYIEIRNKISDQLIDFNSRASKIVETFASGFQKSALALISFYVSAFAIRIISKGNFVNLFTIDTTILSIAFIVGSFMYYRVSLWEIMEQRKRFENSYNNLKLRYSDLLDENDISRILNNDKEFKEDLDFIDNKKKAYKILWLSILIILFVSTLILFFTYNLSMLSDILIFKIIFGKPYCC